MKRPVAIAGTCIASGAILDVMRVLMQALTLRSLRKRYPAMFDGHAAHEAIDLVLKEQS